MKSDYRNTIYEVSKKDIINEKNALEDKIKKEHPKVKIIYNQINKKDGNYNKNLEIYIIINVLIVVYQQM